MVQVDQQVTPQTPLSHAQVGRRILRATGALMFVQVIMRCFGLIEKIIMSHYFGTGDQANAYSAARRIAGPVLQLGEQVIMHSFLPSFVQRMREQGEKDAWRLASTTINIMLLLMGAIAVVGIFFTSHLLSIFLPGWQNGVADPKLVTLTLGLTRVMLVAMIFLAVTSLTYCLLNSYKQFALPASSDLALKGTVLVFAILFARHWGAYALTVGFCVGALGKFAVQAIGLGKRFSNYRPVLDLGNPGLKQFGWLALPLIAGWAFSTFRGVMETRILSMIHDHASLSALDYAKTLTDIPVTFFPYVFGIALFPFLADYAAAGDKERLRNMLMSATRMMILIFVPLAITLIALRSPILNGLYGSKHFDAHSVAITSGPLMIFAITMLASALEIIINQFYFAMSDTVRPTVVGMVLVPVQIGIAYFGAVVLGWGAVAIALGLLVYRSSKVVLLYAMIRRKLGNLEGNNTLKLIGKVALALIPCAIVLFLAATYLPVPSHAVGKLKKLITLLPYGFAAGGGLILYLIVLSKLQVEEVATLTEKIRGKLQKRQGPKPPLTA